MQLDHRQPALRCRCPGQAIWRPATCWPVSRYDVERGEVCAIVGPSGGGKTTFLRCLNGLEDFRGGRIELGRRRHCAPACLVRSANARWLTVRRHVGMVFQQFNLFPHRTALGNVIEAPMHVLGISREQAIGRGHDIARPRGTCRQAAPHARHALGRPTAARGDRPRAGDEARGACCSTSPPVPSIRGWPPKWKRVIADLAASGQTMIVVTHSLRLARRAAAHAARLRSRPCARERTARANLRRSAARGDAPVSQRSRRTLTILG